MRTTLECLAQAEHCESMARASFDEMNKRMLRETAKHWRTLAKVAHIVSDERGPRGVPAWLRLAMCSRTQTAEAQQPGPLRSALALTARSQR